MITISRALFLSLLVLPGCVIIPVPTAEHNYCDRSVADNCDSFKTRAEITDPMLEFMRVGTTTREETLLRLGGPDSVWKNESIFAYQWLMVGGYAFLFYGAASPGAMGGSGASAAWFKKYVLLLDFDAANVVQRCAVKHVGGQSATIDQEFVEKWLAQERPIGGSSICERGS